MQWLLNSDYTTHTALGIYILPWGLYRNLSTRYLVGNCTVTDGQWLGTDIVHCVGSKVYMRKLECFFNETRRFSNHESRLLSRLHTFAIIVIFNRFENTSKYVDTLTLFSKNLNQRSLTPRWPLTPCLLRSHVWLYPRIIVSKSHDDTSMYVDTVINFANYHIHTYTYYVHTTYILHTTYYVQNEWSHSLLLNSVQARQKV